MTHTSWRTDILGEGWSSLTIPVSPDLPGDLAPVATVVRHDASRHNPTAVLALHGFSDYFFHPHVAQWFADHQVAFYALDLRRYGRSLRHGQTPYAVRDLSTYREELDIAVSILRDVYHYPTLVLLGHSTGGLIASRWASWRSSAHAGEASGTPGQRPANPDTGHRHDGAGPNTAPDGSERPIDALILNSPWFRLNEPPLRRVAARALSEAVTPVAPTATLSTLTASYAQAMHVSGGGPWEFDPAFKALGPVAVPAGWLRSVLREQQALRHQPAIDVPVLICTSDRSAPTASLDPEVLRSTDAVLNVADMWQIGPRLGPDVSLQIIPGGTHDLSLSAPAVTAAYLSTVTDWLSQRGLTTPR